MTVNLWRYESSNNLPYISDLGKGYYNKFKKRLLEYLDFAEIYNFEEWIELAMLINVKLDKRLNQAIKAMEDDNLIVVFETESGLWMKKP